MSTLAYQINELEYDLSTARKELRDAEEEVINCRDYICDLELELEEAASFIRYVDKTHPELRVAFEVAQKLEGERK